jgi:nitroreductase
LLLHDPFDLFYDLVRNRRSVRNWADEAVPRADLERMVDCARMAPSDTNAQPWHFTVVSDRTLIRRLEATTRERFAGMAERLAAEGRRELGRKLRVFEKYAAHFGDAPALVVVSGEPYDSRFMREVFTEVLEPAAVERLKQEESIKSTALAAMNLLLAAHALGYGAVPMTGPILAIPEELKVLLRLPPGFEAHLVVALGRQGVRAAAPVPRKELAAITTWIE